MSDRNYFLIILVNYNNLHDTIECIDSLVHAGVEYRHIMVIDNASSYPISGEIANISAEIIVESNTLNLGFSGANNIGLRHALKNNYKYAILLNNDTIVEDMAIKTLVRIMDENAEYALGTGLIRFYPDMEKIWYAGGKLVSWRGMAVHFDYNKSEIEKLKDKNLAEIDFISGCFLCVRTSVLKDLGYLDEDFFLYLEDIEYSARASKLGFKLLFTKESIIYHKCNGERKLKEKTLYYAVRNRKLLIEKCFPLYSRIYFTIVINLKLLFWIITNKPLYKSAKKGLKDYKNRQFGEYTV